MRYCLALMDNRIARIGRTEASFQYVSPAGEFRFLPSGAYDLPNWSKSKQSPVWTPRGALNTQRPSPISHTLRSVGARRTKRRQCWTEQIPDSCLRAAMHGGLAPLRSVHHLGRVTTHRTRDVRGIQLTLIVQGQLAQVTKVLYVEVRRQGADERRRLLEWIRKSMRYADRHDDDRACLGIEVLIAAGEAHCTGGDDKDLIVLVMYVLWRTGRPGRQRRLQKRQTVARMRAVLENAHTDRTCAGSFSFARANHTNTHRHLRYRQSGLNRDRQSSPTVGSDTLC